MACDPLAGKRDLITSLRITRTSAEVLKSPWMSSLMAPRPAGAAATHVSAGRDRQGTALSATHHGISSATHKSA